MFSAMKLWEDKCDEKHEERFFLINLNPLTEKMENKNYELKQSFLPYTFKNYDSLSKQNVIILGYQIMAHKGMLSATELGPVTQKGGVM